jgi:transposase
MLSLTSSLSYYLFRGYADMRKSFDGLCGVVQTELRRNPMSGEVFIFLSRKRNTVKLLHWECGGFVLYYKRLEQGTFEIPVFSPDTSNYQIKWTELMMMIEGISMKNIKHRKRFIDKGFVDNYVNKNNR